MGSRIIVLGAGHAGLACARALAARLSSEDDLVVVAKENYFLYYPYLRDLVAGAASLDEVAFPLRDVLPADARLVVGSVERVSESGREVRVALPDGELVRLSCDQLVIALGSATSFHHVDGAAEHALPFKSAEDALRLRLCVIDALETAAAGGVAPTDIVIAGGGYTGLEVAGALHDLLRRAHREYGAILASRPPRIHIIEGEDRLLPEMPENVSSYAERVVAARGDHVVLGQHITRVEAGGVVLKDGTRIPSAATVWSAGVRATRAVDVLPFARAKDGRLAVDEHLRAAPGVWALGDCAARESMTAQAAEAEARVVASNVVRAILGREPRPLSYHSRGMIVPLGGGLGVAQFGRRLVTGRGAGLMWRAFHFAQLPGASRRVRYVAGWLTGAARQRALLRVPAISPRPSSRRPS